MCSFEHLLHHDCEAFRFAHHGLTTVYTMPYWLHVRCVLDSLTTHLLLHARNRDKQRDTQGERERDTHTPTQTQTMRLQAACSILVQRLAYGLLRKLTGHRYTSTAEVTVVPGRAEVQLGSNSRGLSSRRCQNELSLNGAKKLLSRSQGTRLQLDTAIYSTSSLHRIQRNAHVPRLILQQVHAHCKNLSTSAVGALI